MSWFINENLKVRGPIQFEKLCVMIQRGEVGPRSLIMKEGCEWMPASECQDIPRRFFPAFQAMTYFGSDDSEWYYLAADSIVSVGYQIVGPIKFSELQNLIGMRSLSEDVKIWRRGLSGWVAYNDRPDFV